MMNTAGTTKRIGILAATAAGALALVACGSPTPQVGSVDLRSDAGSAISTSPLPDGVGGQGGTGTGEGQGQRGQGQGQGQGQQGQGQQLQGQQGQGQQGARSFDGEYPVEMGNAGTVVFVVDGRQISVADLSLNEGWEQFGEERDSDEVKLKLRNGAELVEVKGEIDDGRVETDVDIDSPAAPARLTYPLSDAGSVTIDVRDNGFIGLVSQEAAPGWVATVDEGDLREGDVEIQFRNDGDLRSVEFDADVDDGMLNIDIDSTTGFNHFVRGPGR